MKKCSFCILLLLVATVLVGQPKDSTVSPSLQLRCYVVSPVAPLYIVNGEVVDSLIVKTLDPAAIISIEVLKNKRGLETYGRLAEAGVIVITTSEIIYPELKLVNGKDGSPVKSATVLFRNEGHAFTVLSDENGNVPTRTLRRKQQYQVTVSCAGYQSDSFSFPSKGNKLEVRKLVKYLVQ